MNASGVRRASHEERRRLIAAWRLRADRLDDYARQRRREGDLYGPESAEDAELAAVEYRLAADALEADEARS